MPFDGRHFITDTLQTGLLGLDQISNGLRQEVYNYLSWNFNYTERYTECGYTGCAVGYAHIRWPEQVPEAELPTLSRALQVSMKDLTPILGFDIHYKNYYGDIPRKEITPVMVADALGIQYQSALITVKRYLPDEVARLRSYRKRTPKHSKEFVDRLIKMRAGGTTRLNIMAELDLTLSQYQYCMHLNRQNERMGQVRCVVGIKTQKEKRIGSQVRIHTCKGYVGHNAY